MSRCRHAAPYVTLGEDDPLDQGDIFPIVVPVSLEWTAEGPPDPAFELASVSCIVLTQSCDIRKARLHHIVVAPILSWDRFTRSSEIDAGFRNRIRKQESTGYFYLPPDPGIGAPEAVVELYRLYTIPKGTANAVVRAGLRKFGLEILHRERLNGTLAYNFARIGLP